MVVYEFEMCERFFLENSVYLDIPCKYLLLGQCHCLAMFALKIVLKNVQRIDVSCEYINDVIVNEKGFQAMCLGTRVAHDLHNKKSINYLMSDEVLSESTDISNKESEVFCKELYKYVQGKEELFVVLEEPRDRSTRAPTFSIDEAKEACDSYIKILWECI